MQHFFYISSLLSAFIWAIFILLLSALVTFGLIITLLPVFRRYALARPNARSSHQIPTPQGGGFAVLLAIYGVFLSSFAIIGVNFLSSAILTMLATSFGLLVLGGIDDIRPLPALPRFILQCGLITITLAQLPDQKLLLPDIIPLSFERALIGLALLWFVNIVNFMDGIDLITTAQMLPLWIGILFFSALKQDLPLLVLSLCLIGALIGFAPFNWPVARLFLGDIGSLPLGLLSGWALLQIAYNTSLILGLIPALYYICDATITLIRRLLRGEKIWQAHRSHFYQRACLNGHPVLTVVAMIAATNILLTLITGSACLLRNIAQPWIVDSISLLIAALLVSILMHKLGRKPTSIKPSDPPDEN